MFLVLVGQSFLSKLAKSLGSVLSNNSSLVLFDSADEFINYVKNALDLLSEGRVIFSAFCSREVRFPLPSNDTEEPRVVRSFFIEFEVFNFDFESEVAGFTAELLGIYGFKLSNGYLGGKVIIIPAPDDCL